MSPYLITIKVEILGSGISLVNGQRHRSVRRIFQYYVLWPIRCAFIRMYTWQLRSTSVVDRGAGGGRV